MKLSKKIMVVISILVLTAVVTIPAFAANEATISCTVTPKLISVTVSPTSHDYGYLDPGASATSVEITATNNGNVTEDFAIRGSNTAAWTLGTSAGNETYVHKFSTDDPGYTTWTPLTLSNIPLATSINKNNTDKFKLQITTPTSTAATTTQTANVTVVASG